MVCTDAAARGIDIPNVTHVIQADFAASAVEFIHRVSHVLLQSCCMSYFCCSSDHCSSDCRVVKADICLQCTHNVY